MVGTRHDSTTSEGLYSLADAIVVGGHIRLAQYGLSLFIYSLDDGLPPKYGQRLARETRGRITRWDNSNEFHVF